MLETHRKLVTLKLSVCQAVPRSTPRLVSILPCSDGRGAHLSHLGLGAFGKTSLTREKYDISGFKQKLPSCFTAEVFKPF